MKQIAFVILAGISLLLSACGPEAPKSPDEQAFIDANNKILTYGDQFAYGNTSNAKDRANNFSVTMETMQKALFTGGGKLHGFTGGKFLTFCQITPKEIIYLCTVPGMKDYKGEVRDALAELAWTTAQQSSSGLSRDTTLVVALKGALLYGPVWVGKVSGDPTSKESGRDSLKPFYPAFLNEAQQGAAANP